MLKNFRWWYRFYRSYGNSVYESLVKAAAVRIGERVYCLPKAQRDGKAGDPEKPFVGGGPLIKATK